MSNRRTPATELRSRNILTRELTIHARPETVYEVISEPRHIEQWWPDHADLVPTPGDDGTITFGDPASPDAKIVPLTVIEADPPHRFAFRWAYPLGEEPTEANSFLVTFELEADGEGTRLRFTEAGFLQQGWDDQTVAAAYTDHGTAWDRFLPQLARHAAGARTS